MNFTDIFIRRPVLAWVVNILILLGGFQALRNLNVRQYPKSDISVITVTTAYYGANADLVRGFITTPLEQSIASAEGIDYMTSESVLGTSTISVHLKLNYDTNAAMTQVQTKVNQVRNQLPPASQLPVIQIASVDNRFASMYLSFYSKDLDRNQITDYLTRVVQPKLSAINGVQQAEILGARVFAMRIWLKSDRMAALNISPTQIQNILQANNYLSAAGQTKGSMTAINLVANTDLQSVEDFKQLAIKQSNGAIVRLRDVPDVQLGAQSYDSDVRFSGNTANFMGIFVLPTANALDVIKSVRAALPEIQKQLPTGMELDIPYDSTEYISSAIHDVTETLIETLCIVVIVIFLFMGSLRAVIAPVLAIAVELMGAIFLMLLFGFTLNLLTVLAIVLAVGLVVDDAIVVVENVERHLQEGMTPTNAALKGARELFGPIIAMTITLAAVYAPIGIQGGLTGTLFREFAFTLAGAVIVSGVVALTLSPMLASRLLKPGFTERGLAGWITRRFDALRGGYTHLLSGLLGVYPVIIVFSVILWPLMFVFLAMSKNELAPKEDQGVIFGIVQSAPDSTLDQTMLFARDVNDVFKSFPETAQTFQVTPIPVPGFSGLVAKPWKDRNRTMDQLLPEVTKKMAAIRGVNVLATVHPALPGAGNLPVELVVLSTAEPRAMMDFSNQLLTAANKSGKFFFADSDLKYDQPQTRIVFDRDKVAAMGLNLQQVGGDLTTLLSSGYVNYFSIQGRSYQVIPQLKRAERLTPADLANRYVTGPNGTQIQLSTIAHLEREVQPETLNHFQQLNSFTISGANGFGALIDEFANKLQEQGRDKLHAIVEACGTRLRPILMTSVATVSGHFLLMFVTGPGAGARNSIGRVLVPGMIIGTFFTLFVVPSIYLFLAKNHSKDRERRGETPKTEERKLQPALA